MVLDIRNNILNMTSKKDKKWTDVVFSVKKISLSYKLLGLLIIVLSLSFFWAFVDNTIPKTDFLGGLINFLSLVIVIVLWLITTYLSVRWYLALFKKNKSWIANNLSYMIHTLKLYDEETFETIKNNTVVREKRIVRAIRIKYKETDKHVFVRIMRDGDRFTSEATKLGENLESSLGLELDSTNQTVAFAEYTFLKHKDERIGLNSTVTSVNDSDEIKITGNISYELHKVPHSLIVGGTGSGKSFFILGKIINYLKLSPQADLRIIDPKKADLSLLRFVTGFENKVATEASQICRILRETVELMEQRYTDYFNDVSAFGKTYRDFSLPVVIVVFDEFSAFMHSVDKKLAKETLEYVYQIVLKGRQAGVMMEILMQRPSADDLPTNIRAQMGFKAGLGAMDSIGYNMVFDTNNVEYKTVTEKGGGYIQIDGKHTAPVYFETPYIDKDFDFIREIENLVKEKQ
ncbi:cell division protein FtsK [Salipaludibacillus agaradhaerens]|uniref:Cell division protein FtsK n=1 Tax=Salipaludibacillus agaradhaerens TaxID=76935 RepID=A0A9Q4B2K3_SALAG|nr:FtsK/SpoIIIE domain-containing protein [Salipaludibacillus agaradhaerens]MCR6097184.1 cell division protein FtsK [Salipaludibacillus agaradhaerens]MCR6113331.1 cell division protein FtsK [Salipaludibacillus agaradhaerens]